MSAAVDLDDLGGHVGEVLQPSRIFTDPWGWEISGEVIRGDSTEWRQWLLEYAARQPSAAKVRRVTAETVLSDLAPTGARAKRKPSKGESYERMLRKLSEPDEVKIDVLDLRAKKAGIAEVLCRSLTFRGQKMVRRAGREFDLSTPEGRAAFLSHELWEIQGEGGETQTVSIPVYVKGPDGEPLLGEFDEPIENRLGGWNVGDAIAQLIIEEAGDQAAFVAGQRAEVLDRSSATSSGSTAIGSPAPSLSGDTSKSD